MIIVRTPQQADDMAALVGIMQELARCQYSTDQLSVLHRLMRETNYDGVENAIAFRDVHLAMLDDKKVIVFTFLYEVTRGDAYSHTFYYMKDYGVVTGGDSMDKLGIKYQRV